MPIDPKTANQITHFSKKSNCLMLNQVLINNIFFSFKESFDNVAIGFRRSSAMPTRMWISLLSATRCDLTSKKVVDYTTAKELADHLGIPFTRNERQMPPNVEAGVHDHGCRNQERACRACQAHRPSAVTPPVNINKPQTAKSGGCVKQ